MQMKVEKIKANNYDVVYKQVPSDYGVTVPSEIDANCAGLYHCLFIRRTHRPAQEDYLTAAYVKQFQPDAWERKGGVKDNLALLGYTKVYVLHDPKKPVAKAKKIEE